MKLFEMNEKDKKEIRIYFVIGLLIVLCNFVFAAEITAAVSLLNGSGTTAKTEAKERPADAYLARLAKERAEKEKENQARQSAGTSNAWKSGHSVSAYYPEVDGYSDPEEFYYWHEDDFYDYEDAEEYYYEHGGK